MSIIKKDGVQIAEVADDDAAFAWLLRHQGQSVQYATTHGGYEIVTDPPVSPTLGGDCKLVFAGEDDGIQWYRCTVHSTDEHDELVMGTDIYCEKA